MDPITEALEGEPPDYEQPPTAPETREAADRMLWSLKHKRAELEQHAKDFTAAYQRLEVRHHQITAPIEERIEWLEKSLRLWHAARFVEDPKHNISVNLPAGDLTSHKDQPQWTYTDEGAFIAWAEEHLPEGVNWPPQPPRPAKKPDKNAVKKALVFDEKAEPGTKVPPHLPDVVDPESGEIIAGACAPGLVVVAPGRTYDVKVADDDSR
jgi:hypothetical protein